MDMGCNHHKSDFKFNAFLSCAGEDKLYVRDFYNKLKRYGADVFYYDVMDGGSYGKNPTHLYDELKNSQHLIFYWTKNTNKTWINNELKFFEKYCKNGLNREIIIYHDIIGKTDYTELPEDLKDEYYREVNFAELLDRIGADSNAFMERRYFKLYEFINKPRKKIEVPIKVGVGCCIWATPVIRKIMEGGIGCSKITFFSKKDFVRIGEPLAKGKNDGIADGTNNKPNVNGIKPKKYKFKCAPYFYSRNKHNQTILPVPTYLHGCVIAKDEISTAVKDKVKDWMPDCKLIKSFVDDTDKLWELLKEYHKLSIDVYQFDNNEKFFFVHNNLEGGYTLGGYEKLQELIKKTLNGGCVDILEELSHISSQSKKNLIQKFEENSSNEIKKTQKEELKEIITLLERAFTEKASIQESFETFKAWFDDNEQEEPLKLFSTALKIKLKETNFNNYRFQKDLTEPDIGNYLQNGAQSNGSLEKKITINLFYPADDQTSARRRVMIIHNEKPASSPTEGKQFHSLVGLVTEDTVCQVKSRWGDRVEFQFYDDISNTRLYTAKDLVGLIHENKLDCIIVPNEVYGQEHEKGKNRDVLTKVARIMHTVKGGCDFSIVSKRKDLNDAVAEAIEAYKEEKAKQEGSSPNIENELAVPTILQKAKEKVEEKASKKGKNNSVSLNHIRILYTPSTVSEKYAEKYFGNKSYIHEPVDFGDWNSLKLRIADLLRKKENENDVLLILGWQPQMGWIYNHFNGKSGGYVVNNNITLWDTHKENTLPYLSFDVMLRTNALDTWFRSYALEKFLATLKDSIKEFNQNITGNSIKKYNEVLKIALFLNMGIKDCQDYLEKINFEFRYDEQYISLYEKYIRKMDNDC